MPSPSDVFKFLQANPGLLAEPGPEATQPEKTGLNRFFPQTLVDSIERVKADREKFIDPYLKAVAPIEEKITNLKSVNSPFANTENIISDLNKEKEILRAQALSKLQADKAARASNLPTQQVGPNMYATSINVPLATETKAGVSLRQGIEQGSKAAIDQKQGLLSQQQPPQEQGFFGNIGEYINEDFLGRVLAIMARPEAFTDPRGLGAGIARAGQAVFAQEKEQAAAAAKKKLEYDKIQADLQKEAIKASGGKKFTDTVYKTIEKTTAAKRGMDAINTYREILSSGAVGGVGAKFEKIIDRAGAIFNLGSGTLADRATNLRNQLIIELEEAIGSNNLSATELKNSLNTLSNPDSWTKSNANLNKELDIVFKKLQNIENVGANTLEYFGYEPEAFSRKRPLHIGTRPSNR